MAQVDFDRFEIDILRNQLYPKAATAEAFYGDLVFHPGDYDLPVTCLRGAMHRQQIAIQNTGILHAHAFHAQQVMGFMGEQGRINPVFVLDVLLGQDWAARGHAADQRQRHAGGLRQFVCRQGPQGNAARNTTLYTDHRFFFQRPQVGFGSVR